MLKNSLLALMFLSALPACTIRLINVPGEQTGFSNVVNLNVTVESDSVFEEYQFRLAPAGSPDAECTSNLGSYGPLQPRDTALVSDFSGMPDGAIKLCLRARGTVVTQSEGQPPTSSEYVKFASAQWTKDTVPPGAFSITGPSGTQTQNKPVVTWSAAEDASSYTLNITSDAACENIYRTYPAITGTTYEISEGIPNGFWHICITAQDLASNQAVASNNGTLMTVDAPFHYVFATSATYTGAQINGITNADAECTLYAFIGNLIPDWDGVTNVYRAVLSDGSVNAKDRFVLDRSIFNRNNQFVAMGGGLFSAPLSTAIHYDENGSLLGGEVWTGSNADGTHSGASCSDWSSDVGEGSSGLVDSLTRYINDSNSSACNTAKRLLCIGPF